MKAISLRQPWAWLVCKGYKDIEFRNRWNNFTGECYIHASKKFDDDGYQWLLAHPELPGVKEIREMSWCPKIDEDFGKIIGKVYVAACYSVVVAKINFTSNIWLKVAGDTLGDYAFIIQKPTIFSKEDYIPCKGKVFPLFFDVELSENKQEAING